jgi:hypothetical protein
MLKNSNSRGVNCPVAGCNGKWTLETSALDQEYQMRVDRIVRLKISNTTSQQINATQIDDDDDNEYTVV